MAESTFPGSLNTFRDEWAFLMGGDGVIEDYDGLSYRTTASPTLPQITVAPGRCRVAGFYHYLDAPKTISTTTDLPGGVAAPGANQKRVDRTVVRYDWSKPVDEAATVEVVHGSVVSLSAVDTVSLKPLTREYGNVWETPLSYYSVPQGGVVRAQDIINAKVWATTIESFGDYLEPEFSPAPIGRIRQKGGYIYMRTGGDGQAPVWTDVNPGASASFNRRANDDVVPANTDAVVTSTSLFLTSPSQVLADGILRFSQEVTTGNVSIWLTINGNVSGTPLAIVAGVGEQIIPVQALGASPYTPNGATNSVVLRARTTAGNLRVRAGSTVRAVAL